MPRSTSGPSDDWSPGPARHAVSSRADQRNRRGPDVDVLGAVRRHSVLVVVLAVVGGLVALAFSALQPDRYTAEARLFMSSSAAFDGVGDASFVADPDRYLSNQASVVTSEPVLAAAAKAGAANSTDELREEIAVSAALGRDEIRVTATGSTAAQAAQRAELVAQAYRDFAAQAVKSQTEKLVALSTTSDDKAAVLKRAAVFGDGVALLEQATPPTSPSSPQPVRDALLGGIVGLALGLGAALVLDRRPGRAADVRDDDEDAARLSLEELVDRVDERQGEPSRV